MDQLLDAFTKAYIAAALQLFDGEAHDSHEVAQDKHFFYDDLASNTTAQMKADCTKFQTDHAASFDDLPNDSDVENSLTHAGIDFWLTRNRYGAGFWDGDWGTDGDNLTKSAHSFGEFELYLGDDGFIYALGYETPH